MNVKVEFKILKDAVTRILNCHGFSYDNALLISESLVEAEAKGVTSHGISRLQSYITDIENKILIPEATPKVISSAGAVTVIDGNNCSGIIGGVCAANLTMHMARKYGVAFTTVRNIHHTGMLEYFTEIISKNGLIGIAMCNAHPVVASPGGTRRIIGTNPISFSCRGDEEQFNLDFAISESSYGKIRIALKDHEEIPATWAVNKEGRPTSRPEEAIEGALMPSGGYKGFGLGMMVDIMAGLLSSSAAGPEVITWNNSRTKWNNGMLIIVVDYSFFATPGQFKMNFDRYIQNVRQRTSEHQIPGDRRSAAYNSSITSGISISDEMIDELNDMLKKCKIDLKLPN